MVTFKNRLVLDISGFAIYNVSPNHAKIRPKIEALYHTASVPLL